MMRGPSAVAAARCLSTPCSSGVPVDAFLESSAPRPRGSPLVGKALLATTSATGALLAGARILGRRRLLRRRLRCGLGVLQETQSKAAASTRAGEGALGKSFAGGELLVLCGPSGAGKSTLLKGIFDDERFEGRLGLSVSHTTRTSREGELDGVHYHFVAREEMETMIAEGGFLEHAEVHGNLYGTSIGAIQDVFAGGRACVLDIDLQGMRKIRTLTAGPLSECKVSFVYVKPSGGIASLEARLRARGADDEASIRKRMATARKELEESAACAWDHIILNKDGALNDSMGALGDIVDEFLGSRLGEAAILGPADAQEAAVVPASRKNVFAEFSGLARRLGRDCVDLGQGFPNFDPPDFVVQALRDELEMSTDGGPRTRHQYTRTMGHPALVEILADRYSRHLGRELDPMREVAITVGATNALFLALQTALSRSAPEANEIVALEPFFELYRSQADGLGATFRTVPLRFDETDRSFSLDVDALTAALGPQTCALIVNTPHNPTGKAFAMQELLAIAEVVRRHPHILVISDEVYKYMVFDAPHPHSQDPNQPHGHIHFANLPDMWSQTLTVSSAGKTFGITGWQIGWCIGPSHWLEPIHRYMPNLQFCAPTLMQRALGRVFNLAALPFEDQPNYYEWLRSSYAKRRSRMVRALEAAGVRTAKSQGGFFLLGDISALCGADGPLGASWVASEQPGEPRDWTFSRALAKELGIVSLPISPFFGPDAPEDLRSRFVRFCFAKTDGTLTEFERRVAKLNK